jgi:guanylate kinase
VSEAVDGDGFASRPLIVVLHGPAGVGKDSVIARLCEAAGIHRAMSTTDRAMRPGEKNGVDYHFVSTEEFQRKIDNGEFAEHARVYGQWKGLERAEIEGPLSDGLDVIIRTDVQGARSWRARLVGAVSIAIVAADPKAPASIHRELTRERITRRDPRIDPDELERRLRELEEELADLPNNDYVVVNHHNGLDSAVNDILAIIRHEKSNPTRPAPALKDAAPDAV